MKSEPPESAATFARALKALEHLSAKDQEIVLLKDQAEKSTGAEAVDLNRQISDKAK